MASTVYIIWPNIIGIFFKRMTWRFDIINSSKQKISMMHVGLQNSFARRINWLVISFIESRSIRFVNDLSINDSEENTKTYHPNQEW